MKLLFRVLISVFGGIGIAIMWLIDVFAGRGSAATNIVRLDSGPVRGTVSKSPHKVIAYRGIPYADTTAGKNRWRPPQPVKPWNHERRCSEFGPGCYQKMSIPVIGSDPGPNSEDCLSVNVWTPAHNSNENLPVMVWIHGGGFAIGSSSLPMFDGHRLAAQGAVIVTMNYRLGPLGFLAHPSLSAESPTGTSGNYGLLDQIAALQWVQRNIEQFGGDPSRVTIFGESAGAISVLCLMASPLAKGLFHQAICESGNLQTVAHTLRGGVTESAEEMGLRLAKLFGARGPDAIQKLRNIPAQELISKIKPLIIPTDQGDALYPIVDGYALPEHPLTVFAQGRQHPVPLIIGSNGSDGSVLARQLAIRTVDDYRDWLRRTFHEGAEEVEEMFPANTEDKVSSALGSVLTVWGFHAPARYIADCVHASGTPVWAYRFTRVPPALDRFGIGAIHTVEIPYVFRSDIIDQLPRIDQQISRVMSRAWLKFSESGDPSTPALMWSRYSADAPVYLEFNEPPQMVDEPFERASKFFNQYPNCFLYC